MKIEIRYTKNTDVDAPCCAKTEVMGEGILAIGKTWAEAKSRLLDKVSAWLSSTAPAPETVDIPCKDDDWENSYMRVIEKVAQV